MYACTVMEKRRRKKKDQNLHRDVRPEWHDALMAPPGTYHAAVHMYVLRRVLWMEPDSVRPYRPTDYSRHTHTHNSGFLTTSPPPLVPQAHHHHVLWYQSICRCASAGCRLNRFKRRSDAGGVVRTETHTTVRPSEISKCACEEKGARPSLPPPFRPLLPSLLHLLFVASSRHHITCSG